MHGTRLNSPAARLSWLLFCLALAPTVSSGLRAQSDDFDDGNDTGWTRYSPLTILGAPVTFSFPSDGLGGKAYRFQCPAPPVSDAGPARALSYHTTVYSDFYAAVDIAGFDADLNQAFGFVFRGENIGLGTTTGYVLNYDPQQASGGRGQLQINRVAGERDTGTIGAANVTLDPSRKYRLVLTATGSDFAVQVYDLVDLTLPLAGFTANDSTSGSGLVGLFNFYRGSSTTDKSAGRADTTFDNYFASAKPPGLVPPPATVHSIPGMPQVVNRTPLSRASLHAAAKGLRFTATTLTTNRIKSDAIRLWLNGADVSAKLAVSGSSSNLNVSFVELSPNTLYDARIVLEDFSGKKSTNDWTFDTLTEEFLSSGAVKVIEAEDYNYEGGKFQESPLVSGLSNAGAPVNGNGVGYYDLVGVPEVDYFDYSSQAGSGSPPEYRAADFVGTQAGSLESGGSGLDNPPQNDTRRAKYAARDLPEFQVRRTEGGEWLNYTRTFTSGEYHVYLRAGARAPQAVQLDRVASDRTKPNQTTAPFGTFQVSNTGMIVNYRFVPLADATGKIATVQLSGLETLRLTLGGPQQNSTQYTMTLNYLLFVPAKASAAEVQLESAPAVVGPYAVDPAAVVNASDRTIAVSPGGSPRFFRLRANANLPRITSVQFVNGSLVIRYSTLD